MSAEDFAADLAALACFHDPEDRRSSRILSAVVLAWSQLKAMDDPSFFIDGPSMVVAGHEVPLRPAWRESLRFVEGALKSHGCGGVQVTGFADRNTILAFLKTMRSSVAPGASGDLRRTFERYGGTGVEFLPPRPTIAWSEAATWSAWEDLLSGSDPVAALQCLIERMEQGSDALARALATLPPRPWHPAAGVVGRALLLGNHLGLGRGALLELALCAIAGESASHPEVVRLDRATARRVLVTLALQGESSLLSEAFVHPSSRRPGERPHLFARLLSIVRELDLSIREEGPRRLTPHAAVARIQADAGRQHDPVLIAAMVAAIGEWPIGSTILLSGGEVAVVTSLASNAGQVSRPVVRVVVDRSGARVTTAEAIDLSLPVWSRTQILASLDPATIGLRLEAVLAPG